MLCCKVACGTFAARPPCPFKEQARQSEPAGRHSQAKGHAAVLLAVVQLVGEDHPLEVGGVGQRAHREPPVHHAVVHKDCRRGGQGGASTAWRWLLQQRGARLAAAAAHDEAGAAPLPIRPRRCQRASVPPPAPPALLTIAAAKEGDAQPRAKAHGPHEAVVQEAVEAERKGRQSVDHCRAAAGEQARLAAGRHSCPSGSSNSSYISLPTYQNRMKNRPSNSLLTRYHPTNKGGGPAPA